MNTKQGLDLKPMYVSLKLCSAAGVNIGDRAGIGAKVPKFRQHKTARLRPGMDSVSPRNRAKGEPHTCSYLLLA